MFGFWNRRSVNLRAWIDQRLAELQNVFDGLLPTWVKSGRSLWQVIWRASTWSALPWEAADPAARPGEKTWIKSVRRQLDL